MRLFSGLARLFRATRSNMRPARRRLGVESLEERCQPSAVQFPVTVPPVIKLPMMPSMSQTQTQVVNAQGETVTRDGLSIAIGHSAAIAKSIQRLKIAQGKTPPTTIARDLLGQSIKVLQAEQVAMARMINTLHKVKLTPQQQVIKVFTLESHFAMANAALQTHQVREILAGKMSKFVIPVSF